MTYTEDQIYESLNTENSITIIGSSKEIIQEKREELGLVIKCLPPVFPINYKELKEKNPERFAELYDLDQKRSTLEGFKEELKALIANNKDKSVIAQKKLIKGTSQFDSYQEALQQILETTVENAGHRYAKTFNFAKSHSFILIDNEIEIVADLLSEVINNAIEVQTNDYVNDVYDMGTDYSDGIFE